MGKHYEITWRLAAIALWSVALIVAFVTTTPKPWTLTILGISLGGVSGYLGARSIRKGAFSAAARALPFACGIGLLILAMAFAVDMFIGAWVASFAAYLLTASVLVLPTLLRKQRLEVAADGT
jgi:hypothetical protein